MIRRKAFMWIDLANLTGKSLKNRNEFIREYQIVIVKYCTGNCHIIRNLLIYIRRMAIVMVAMYIF